MSRKNSGRGSRIMAQNMKIIEEKLFDSIKTRSFEDIYELLKQIFRTSDSSLINSIVEKLRANPELIEDLLEIAKEEIEHIDEGLWRLYGIALVVELLGFMEKYYDASRLVLSTLSAKPKSVNLDELYKTMLYSTILSFPPDKLADLINMLIQSGIIDSQAASEALTGFVELAPHSYLVNEELLFSLADLIEEILVQAMNTVKEPSSLERIYSNVSVFLSELYERCREIHDYSPCEKIKKRKKMFDALEKIGKEILRLRAK